MRAGLMNIGFKEESILDEEQITRFFTNGFTSGALGLEKAIFSPAQEHLFNEDEQGIYHPIVKDVSRYRDTVRHLTDIMLIASNQEINYDRQLKIE